MAGIFLARALFEKPFAIYLLIITAFLLIFSVLSHRLAFKSATISALSKVLLFLAIISLGALMYTNSRLPAQALYSKVARMKSVEGAVVSYPLNKADRSAFVLKPKDEIGYLQVFYYHRDSSDWLRVNYGDVLKLTGRFQIPWEFEDFNYREYLLQRNIWGVVSIRAGSQIERLDENQGNSILHWGYRAREFLFALIDKYLSAPQAGLLKGLLFGERAFLSKEIEESFRDAGVMHVLAVSGMNLGMILVIFWWALRLFKFSHTKIHLIALPFVLFYLLVVGFEVSLLRATIIFLFVALGLVVAERGLILKSWADLFQALSAAALAILVFQPQALFDVSFQLSFAATAAILFFLPPVQKLLERWQVEKASKTVLDRVIRRSRGWLAVSLAVSIAAQLGVMPILAYSFNRVYLLALFANLIVVPLVTLALWGGILVLVLGVLKLSAVASLLGALEGWLLSVLSASVDFFADVPLSYVGFGRGAVILIILAFPAILSLRLILEWWVAGSKQNELAPR